MGQHLDQKLASKNGLASSPYLNAETIRRLSADHQSGRVDNSRALWLIWMFEEFMESEAGIAQTGQGREWRVSAGGQSA
jgi:hypothetical protein